MNLPIIPVTHLFVVGHTAVIPAPIAVVEAVIRALCGAGEIREQHTSMLISVDQAVHTMGFKGLRDELLRCHFLVQGFNVVALTSGNDMRLLVIEGILPETKPATLPGNMEFKLILSVWPRLLSIWPLNRVMKIFSHVPVI